MIFQGVGGGGPGPLTPLDPHLAHTSTGIHVLASSNYQDSSLCSCSELSLISRSQKYQKYVFILYGSSNGIVHSIYPLMAIKMLSDHL